MKLFAICLFPVTVINAIIVQMSFEMEEIDQLFKYITLVKLHAQFYKDIVH